LSNGVFEATVMNFTESAAHISTAELSFSVGSIHSSIHFCRFEHTRTIC